MGIRLLETLTTALYADAIVLFREYIQNSADAYNESIEQGLELDDFTIRINIDRENRIIQILDNGYGIEKSDFEETA